MRGVGGWMDGWVGAAVSHREFKLIIGDNLSAPSDLDEEMKDQEKLR